MGTPERPDKWNVLSILAAEILKSVSDGLLPSAMCLTHDCMAAQQYFCVEIDPIFFK